MEGKGETNLPDNNWKENVFEADRVRSYSRFFHSRVMAMVVSGVDRSTLFRGRFIVRSRSEAHAHRPIEIRLACRSRVRADRAHARTHTPAPLAIRARRCTRPATSAHKRTSTRRDANARWILHNSSPFVTSVRMRPSPRGLTSSPLSRYIQHFSNYFELNLWRLFHLWYFEINLS